MAAGDVRILRNITKIARPNRTEYVVTSSAVPLPDPTSSPNTGTWTNRQILKVLHANNSYTIFFPLYQEIESWSLLVEK